MEPVRIELKNFTCYEHETFDFSPVTMAALCGPNGAGKSSLIDAVLWALFGQTPRSNGKQLDSIVRQGTDLTEVVFDFRIDKKLYRIRRVRDARRGRSAVELYTITNDGLEPMNGANATETQGLVEKLLRMDYKTFVATSVIVQGKSDLLTSDMTDAERKDVLARILGLDQWEGAQETVKEKLQTVKFELSSIDAQINQLEDQINQAGDIDEKIKATEAELREMSLILDGLRKIARDQEQAESLRRELERVEQIIGDAQKQIQSANEVMAKQTEIQEAYMRFQAVEAELSSLAEKERAWDHLQKELTKAKDEAIRWNTQWEREVQRLEVEIRHARQQASLLEQVPCSGTDYSRECQLLQQARGASESLAQLTAQLEDWQSKTNPHESAIKILEEHIERLGYDPEHRRRLEHERSELQPLASLMPLLENAQASLTQNLARLQENVKHQVRIRAELVNLEASMKDESYYGISLEEAEGRVSNARERLGSLRAQKELVEEATTKLKQLSEKRQGLARRLEVLMLLERACNKNTGVPTLIIESAVPQIEALANDFLGKLTQGRFQIRLETQVKTKSGTVQEALRILVLDRGSERAYETYSGGEKFLIDLAIRIALSRFLAHRAGASVNLLVIDEGIASMDVSRRHLIIEAINALKDEFSKVLVISHLPELEDAFPQRIEAVPGPSGTKLRLVA